MLIDRFSQPDIKNGFILDGYPRNISQAKTLGNILREKGMSVSFVIYLDTSDSVIIQRLSGRLVCRSCGENFHITNMPPKIDRVCDNCGGELYQRLDDKEETIKKRIEVYKKEVTPLIRYYEAQQKLQHILADEEAEIVLNKMIRLAQEYNDPLKV
jgi:adenylate kinase